MMARIAGRTAVAGFCSGPVRKDGRLTSETASVRRHWHPLFSPRSGANNTKRFAIPIAMILGLASAAHATPASADDIVTKAQPAATTKALSQPATCSSLEDFVVTACPLTWNGITVYGTIDGGVTWMSHGAPFNGTSAVGADYIIQKLSNRPQ